MCNKTIPMNVSPESNISNINLWILRVTVLLHIWHSKSSFEPFICLPVCYTALNKTTKPLASVCLLMTPTLVCIFYSLFTFFPHVSWFLGAFQTLLKNSLLRHIHTHTKKSRYYWHIFECHLWIQHFTIDLRILALYFC